MRYIPEMRGPIATMLVSVVGIVVTGVMLFAHCHDGNSLLAPLVLIGDGLGVLVFAGALCMSVRSLFYWNEVARIRLGLYALFMSRDIRDYGSVDKE